MPSHTPNHSVVCLFNLMEHSARASHPVDNLPVRRCRAGTCEKLFFERMPGQNSDLIVVSLEAVELFVALADIKHFYLLILTARQEPIPVDWVPSHLADRVVVGWNRGHTFAALPRVPDLAKVVFTPGEDERLEGVPVATFDIAPVVGENKVLFARCEIENFGGRVVSAGDELDTRLTKAQVSDASFVVRLKYVFLAEFHITVHDFAFLISADDVFLKVAQGDRLHCLFMHSVRL